MHMFCGDSHTRTFVTTFDGRYSYTIFSGATIKGLTSDKSKTRHGSIFRELAAIPTSKTLFLMLGGVDLDFSFYRDAAATPDFDETRFFEERIAAYNRFLTDLLAEARPYLDAIRVLAPHLSPLGDAHFAEVTQKQAQIDPIAMRGLIARMDCSHRARIARTVRFNTMLEGGLVADDIVRSVRIDRAMVDETGLIRHGFVGRNLKEHHCERTHALTQWVLQLQDDVPAFKARARRFVRRHPPVPAPPATNG